LKIFRINDYIFTIPSVPLWLLKNKTIVTTEVTENTEVIGNKRDAMQKTVLVVGGAGYIGSHVTKMLHEVGYNTVVLDNLSRGNRKAVTQGTFIEGDIADNACLETLFKDHKIDAVMHFAALIDVGESIVNPSQYYANNVAATLNLLNAILRHSIKTFIFSSTAAVYGIPLENPIPETHPCKPINPYGESKLFVEKILRDYDQAYGLKSCCLRYFNAAGGDPDGEIKNYKSKESNLIPIALRSLLNPQSKLTIYGSDYPTPDGTCIRDYVHVCDLATAHITAMEQLMQGQPSSIYNLGTGQGFSVREVIHAIEKVTDKKLNIIEGQRRPGDPPILVADAQRAKKELHWKPRFSSLETMIDHAWKSLIN
jgi:UDP-glucose 4-epimerase